MNWPGGIMPSGLFFCKDCLQQAGQDEDRIKCSLLLNSARVILSLNMLKAESQKIDRNGEESYEEVRLFL